MGRISAGGKRLGKYAYQCRAVEVPLSSLNRKKVSQKQALVSHGK
jgi:hypothetical protein